VGTIGAAGCHMVRSAMRFGRQVGVALVLTLPMLIPPYLMSEGEAHFFGVRQPAFVAGIVTLVALTVVLPIAAIVRRPTGARHPTGGWLAGIRRVPARVAAGVLAGVGGALVSAVLARMAMRMVALAGNQPPIWTTQGIIEIALFASMLGAVIGPYYILIRRWVPGTGVRKGLTIGVMTWTLYGGMLVAEFTNIADEVGRGPGLLGVALLSAIVIGNGVVVEHLAGRLVGRRARIADPAGRAPAPVPVGAAA
jgi:hypothetical protein